MQEKDMVKDILCATKASLGDYQTSIADTVNPSLRSALQQLRDGAEQFQYQLYQVAEQKGYVNPAEAATQQQLTNLKSQLTQS